MRQTVGIGKGGTIPLKVNGIVQSYQRDQNDEVNQSLINPV
jgi:Ca-activated chloride channel family protein